MFAKLMPSLCWYCFYLSTVQHVHSHSVKNGFVDLKDVGNGFKFYQNLSF